MKLDSKKRRFLPFLIIQFIAVLLLLSFLVFMTHATWNVARSIGLILMIVGAIFLFTARFQLGNSFAVTAQARELVTSGLYSRIRNPIYVFSSLMVLGLFMILGRPYLFALFAVLLVVQTIRAGKEAHVLEGKFGDQYRNYRKQTWL